MSIISQINEALENVDPLQYQTRLNICKNCPAFNQTTKTCSDCLCFMPVKAKLKSQECPRKIWR